MTRDDIIRAAQDVNTMQNENTVIKLQDNEVLRVTAEGDFIWNENADNMIAHGDYSNSPSLQHILKALRKVTT